MLAGPLLGSMLYEAGGFKAPFGVTGGLLIIFGFVVFINLKNDKQNKTDTYVSINNSEPYEVDEENPPKETIGMSFF